MSVVLRKWGGEQKPPVGCGYPYGRIAPKSYGCWLIICCIQEMNYQWRGNYYLADKNRSEININADDAIIQNYVTTAVAV